MGERRTWIGTGPARVTAVGRSRGAPGLTRLYGAARFVLDGDGSATVLPAPGHLADDLAPLHGTWTGDRLAVRCAPEPWRALTITGRVSGGRFTGRHELTVGDDTHTHDVDAPLTDDPAAVRAGAVREIGGIPAPVALAGTLEGRCGGRAFGPVAIGLTLLDPVPGADQPLEVLLAPREHGTVGGVLWCSGAPGLGREDTGDLVVTALDGRLRATVHAPSGAALGVTFTAPLDGAFAVGVPGWTPPPLPGVPGVDVVARTASLDLRVRRDGPLVHVEGTVRAAGTLPATAVDLDAVLRASGPR